MEEVSSLLVSFACTYVVSACVCVCVCGVCVCVCV